MASSYIHNQPEQEEDTMKDKYLTFMVGSENYAVPIKYVIEIMRVLPVTPMPDFPSYFEGITNLRGRIIPIMNIRKRLGMEVIDYTDTTCFMILMVNDKPYGLVVDSISEVVNITDADITPPPLESGTVSSYILGIAKVKEEIRLVINCETIFTD